MHVLEVYANNTYKLYDSYSKGHEVPQSDESLGGTYDLVNPTYTPDINNFVNITYERLYDTKDTYDKKLNPVIFKFFYRH